MKKKRGLRAEPNPKNKPKSSSPHEEAERAFLRLQPDRDALEPHELIRPNVDVPRAVGVVLASLPAIAELLPRMKSLPNFDHQVVDELRDVALAAEYASAVFPRPPPDRTATELAREARALHRKLLAQARAGRDRDPRRCRGFDDRIGAQERKDGRQPHRAGDRVPQ